MVLLIFVNLAWPFGPAGRRCSYDPRQFGVKGEMRSADQRARTGAACVPGSEAATAYRSRCAAIACEKRRLAAGIIMGDVEVAVLLLPVKHTAQIDHHQRNTFQ